MPKHIPLSHLEPGQSATVVEVVGGQGIHCRLKALGIRPGIEVKKVSGRWRMGPVVLRHGQTQTALGAGICRKIIVEVDE